MSIESEAKLRFFRMAPRKVRLVADLIRGKHVEEALTVLQFAEKGAAAPLAKLLKSAVANADQKKANVDKLWINDLQVQEGPMLKRYRPRAQGRATPIRKRSSHISIKLIERD
jgi:large subunit ribosomal protein L22